MKNPQNNEQKSLEHRLQKLYNKTLKGDQCRYCKDASHTTKDCPNLAKPRKLEEDPDAPKRPNCKIPCHDEGNCYSGANTEKRPLKWALTEAQKKTIENY